MLILNFTHPLTNEQQAQIEALANTSIEELRTIPVQINQEEPLEPQITAIVDTTGLSSVEWQTLCWLHMISSEKNDNLPLQLPCHLTPSIQIKSG